jgi:Transglycosylase SLT domain
MRRLLLLPVTLLFVVSAFAQERPRIVDNIHVQVHSPQPANYESPKPTARIDVNHYLPSPLTGQEYKNWLATRPAPEIELVKKTAQVTMTLSDGYSQREFLRPAETKPLAMGTGSRLQGYSTGDDVIDSFITDSSHRYNIDPLLIFSQMSQESSFKPRATSNKGASGLMQLMPATAIRLGVTNIYDPKENIEGGVKYMRILLDMFSGDVNLALAGYNAGEGAVMKYGYRIPPYAETQDYVRRISARYLAISNPTISRNIR